MGKYMWLYGIDSESEDAYVELDSGVKIRSVRANAGKIYEISETLNKLGLDTNEFLRIFRVYDDEYFRSLSSEEQTKLLREASEFIIDTEDIKRLRDFCKEAIKRIEESVNLEEVRKEMDKVPYGESLYDYIDKFKIDCYDARGALKVMLAMCEKALELGVKILVA